MTPEKQIKAMLVVLAEYLQTNLSDIQVRLYADELADMGPAGVNAAISALKADESVWAGRFPLPAKIRSYVSGEIQLKAVEGATRILRCDGAKDIRSLPLEEREVALAYGAKAILERDATQSSTIYAQLREALKARYSTRITEARLGLPDHTRKLAEEIERAKNLSLPAGENHDPVVVPGRSFDESEG